MNESRKKKLFPKRTFFLSKGTKFVFFFSLFEKVEFLYRKMFEEPWNIGSIFHDTQRLNKKKKKSFISNWCQIKISFLFFFLFFTHYMTISKHTHNPYLTQSLLHIMRPFFLLMLQFLLSFSQWEYYKISEKWNWLFFYIWTHTSPFFIPFGHIRKIVSIVK